MSKSSLKNKRNKRIIKSRHRLSLQEHLSFTAAAENEMRRQMDWMITKAFPNAMERANYIASLIRELDREIREHKDE